MARRQQIRFIVLTALALAVLASGIVAAQEKVTVSWLGTDDPERFALDRLIEEFHKIEPNIDINYMYTPRGQTEKLTAMLAAGDPPDITRLNDDYVVAYAVRDLLYPVDQLFAKYPLPGADEYHPSVWEWPIVNGKHQSFILGVTNRTFYVNERLFADAGLDLPPKKYESPDWTWDTFLDTAKKLTVDKNNDGFAEIWGVGILHETGAEQTWAYNNGTPGIYGKDGGREFTLASERGIEAMQWLADLAYVHKVHPPRALLDQRAAEDIFIAGQMAMDFETTRAMPHFRDRIHNFDYAVRPVPMRVRGYQEGSLDTHAILKGAKNPEAAFKWLRFLMTEPAQKIIAEVGWMVPLKTRWVEDYFIDPSKLPNDQDILVESLNYYVPVPKATNVERARQIYRVALDDLWYGNRTAREILLEAKPKVEEANAAFPDANF